LGGGDCTYQTLAKTKRSTAFEKSIGLFEMRQPYCSAKIGLLYSGREISLIFIVAVHTHITIDMSFYLRSVTGLCLSTLNGSLTKQNM